jgi:hypothetical protein
MGLGTYESEGVLPVIAIVMILLIGAVGANPVFATFCQVSNHTYNYPQQVTPGQSFSTSVTVSGVCASDDADYYTLRVDLNDMSGLILSANSVPIGLSQGQNWTISATNLVTAPMSPSAWQNQFAVYVFASIGSGGTIDSVTVNPVTIRVGSLQAAQTTTNSVTTISQAGIATTSMISAVAPTVMTSTQTEQSGSSTQLYQTLAAFLIIVLVTMVIILIKQRQSRQNQK